MDWDVEAFEAQWHIPIGDCYQDKQPKYVICQIVLQGGPISIIFLIMHFGWLQFLVIFLSFGLAVAVVVGVAHEREFRQIFGREGFMAISFKPIKLRQME